VPEGQLRIRGAALDPGSEPMRLEPRLGPSGMVSGTRRGNGAGKKTSQDLLESKPPPLKETYIQK
jgi:hypothetical protein